MTAKGTHTDEKFGKRYRLTKDPLDIRERQDVIDPYKMIHEFTQRFLVGLIAFLFGGSEQAPETVDPKVNGVGIQWRGSIFDGDSELRYLLHSAPGEFDLDCGEHIPLRPFPISHGHPGWDFPVFGAEVEALTYLVTTLDDEPKDEGSNIFRPLMIRNKEVQDTGDIAYVLLERRRTALVAIQTNKIAGVCIIFRVSYY